MASVARLSEISNEVDEANFIRAFQDRREATRDRMCYHEFLISSNDPIS